MADIQENRWIRITHTLHSLKAKLKLISFVHVNSSSKGATLKNREKSYLQGTLVPDASGSFGTVIVLIRKTRRSGLLAVLALAVMTLGILIPSYGQETKGFNCTSGFTSSGACSFNLVGGGSGVSLSGSKILLINRGVTHASAAATYRTKVNDQAFTTSFEFMPNGQNIAFVLQNNNNNPGYDGVYFAGGAGCEAGFFQAFGANAPPNNVFALELDSYSPTTVNGSFTNSSVQIYHTGQSPCLPNDNGPNYTPIDKISTSPVNLTTGRQDTTTGHTYEATLTYDGSSLTINLSDKTAGNSCPGTKCFTHTWDNVAIPSLVDGDTAYVAITGATGMTSISPLYVDSFIYTPGAGKVEGIVQ
jgi:hypothetical protein